MMASVIVSVSRSRRNCLGSCALGMRILVVVMLVTVRVSTALSTMSPMTPLLRLVTQGVAEARFSTRMQRAVTKLAWNANGFPCVYFRPHDSPFAQGVLTLIMGRGNRCAADNRTTRETGGFRGAGTTARQDHNQH